MTEFGIVSCIKKADHENNDTRFNVDTMMRHAVRRHCNACDKVMMPNSETWKSEWILKCKSDLGSPHFHRMLVVDLQDAVHAA